VISGSGLLCTRPYSEVRAVLEMAFNAFTTEWVFRLGQNDRADDLIASNLRSQKHFPFRKVRVGKFHELTASIHICPFIFHLFDPGLQHQRRLSSRLFNTTGLNNGSHEV
jgi:hypothetical protein